MTIFKSPFKSLPAINDSKNGAIRANSEEPTVKADNVPPVVCVTNFIRVMSECLCMLPMVSCQLIRNN